jgi:WD40 repeat protein
MSAATSRDNASPNSPPITHLPRHTLHGHFRRVWCVVLFPDNEHAVSASDDDFIIIWNLRTKEQERRWSHKGATAVAVSPNGKLVVSGGRDCALRLWDAESGDLLSGPWELHKDRVWSVTWSPDGSRIASCSADGNLIIWNARPASSSGETFLEPTSTGHDVVRAVAYCPKGGRVATGGNDCMIRIWDVTGHLQATLRGHAERVLSVAWTKDGSRVISGSADCTARIWDPEGGKECGTLAHTGAAISCVAVSDHIFATASTNDTIFLWNLKTYECLNDSFELPKRDQAHCIALTADENTLIACTEKSGVYLFDIGEIILGLEGRAWRL